MEWRLLVPHANWVWNGDFRFPTLIVDGSHSTTEVFSFHVCLMSDVINRSCASHLESSLPILSFSSCTLYSRAKSVLFRKLIWYPQSQVELPGETYVFHWTSGRAGAERGICLLCLIRELVGLFVPLCVHVCAHKGSGEGVSRLGG